MNCVSHTVTERRKSKVYPELFNYENKRWRSTCFVLGRALYFALGITVPVNGFVADLDFPRDDLIPVLDEAGLAELLFALLDLREIGGLALPPEESYKAKPTRPRNRLVAHKLSLRL